MTDLLPPPPNAAALTKYGGIGLNKNTGAPNFSIPLYSVKGKTLQVPVSLNYSSQGIKVDEIASRAGMGWVLNGGGVITRTVRGWADETHTRIIPWWTSVGINWPTFRFMRDVTNAWFYSGVDSEPDLFSFNFPGGSGNFVLDHNMNAVQQTYSNQKITHNFSGTDWNFKITDANGIEYYFGGSGRVEKTKRTSTCSKSFDGFVTTAWYIKKILHPSGEEINFDYTAHNYSNETGLSQSYIYTSYQPRVEGGGVCSPLNTNGCAGANSHAVMQTTCVNRVTTEGVVLSSITCANTYQRVSFSYTTRQDCDDKLLSAVSFINLLDTSTVGSFIIIDTTYTSSSSYSGVSESYIDKTPYLLRIIESGASGSGVPTKTHSFQYLDPASRPKRLSYAQDHWGYFNGKNNDNMLPPPPTNDLFMASRFPDADANREPDGEYVSKGLLCGIVYPTGGKDSIVYEANQSTNLNPYTRLPHVFNCNVQGPGGTNHADKTADIYIGNTQTIELKISVTTSTGFFDSTHDFGKVFITDASGGPEYEELFNPGTTNAVRYVNLTGNTTGTTKYKVKIRAQRDTSIRTFVEVKYISYAPIPGVQIGLTGGVRVKSVLTSNENNVPMIKRYYYGELSSLNSSSSTMPAPKNYMKSYETRTTCIIGTSPPIAAKNYCASTALYSSSLFGLYNYQSSPVSYTSVVESIGENFEGGGTQSRFQAISDQKGQVLWGNEMLDAPLTAFSNFGNGTLIEETHLKKATGGQLVPVKKTVYTPHLDSLGFKAVWGYTVNKKFEYGPIQPIADADSLCVDTSLICQGNIASNMECFDMMRYEFPSYWIYTKEVKDYVYDQNGQNPILTHTLNYYDSVRYQQLTRTKTINSKGDTLTTELKYPNDFTSQTVYNEMTSKNIIAPVITSKSLNTSTEISFLRNKYRKDTIANNYLIDTIETSVAGNTPESIGEILRYDAKSNICEFKGKDGITNVIIWGYNYLYPVAKVVNASYVSVVAQLSGGVSAIQSLDGTTLLSALHNIRTGLPNAFVTTYTYKHLGGVTSITDHENRKTTYAYDGYNRLVTITDKDGKVVKKNEYSYSSTQLSKMGLYVNDAITDTFTTTGCTSGYKGSQVIYGVPAGRYYSTISVSDANSKALVDLTANGQSYANKMGNCVLETSGCVGEALRVVGCGCEIGIKTCVSSSQNPDSTWSVSYYYTWSDSFQSSTISDTITCSGPAYKMINCTCRQGFKVYTSSTLITTGPNAPYWECVFHYHWPDGSDSGNYTEINSSPCQLTIQ